MSLLFFGFLDSFSVLLNHVSFQQPDPFPTWDFDGFLKRFGSLERMGKVPLDFLRVSVELALRVPKQTWDCFLGGGTKIRGQKVRLLFPALDRK